jgi:transcriptional antiterminator RfaH
MGFWACVRTELRRENLACAELGRRGFEVYCPRISEKTIRRGRTVVVVRSLFIHYLFITIEAQFYDAMWCPGVATLLLDGERPAQVPPKVIADLRSREGRDGLIQLPPPPRFRLGEPVQITKGVFNRQDGTLSGYARG